MDPAIHPADTSDGHEASIVSKSKIVWILTIFLNYLVLGVLAALIAAMLFAAQCVFVTWLNPYIREPDVANGLRTPRFYLEVLLFPLLWIAAFALLCLVTRRRRKRLVARPMTGSSR